MARQITLEDFFGLSTLVPRRLLGSRDRDRRVDDKAVEVGLAPLIPGPRAGHQRDRGRSVAREEAVSARVPGIAVGGVNRERELRAVSPDYGHRVARVEVRQVPEHRRTGPPVEMS